jgi:hypothetical protein
MVYQGHIGGGADGVVIAPTVPHRSQKVGKITRIKEDHLKVMCPIHGCKAMGQDVLIQVNIQLNDTNFSWEKTSTLGFL